MKGSGLKVGAITGIAPALEIRNSAAEIVQLFAAASVNATAIVPVAPASLYCAWLPSPFAIADQPVPTVSVPFVNDVATSNEFASDTSVIFADGFAELPPALSVALTAPDKPDHSESAITRSTTETLVVIVTVHAALELAVATKSCDRAPLVASDPAIGV